MYVRRVLVSLAALLALALLSGCWRAPAAAEPARRLSDARLPSTGRLMGSSGSFR